MKSLQQNITVGHYEESEECETEEKSLNLMKINSEHPKPITTQAEDSCHQSTLLRRQTRMCKASTLTYHMQCLQRESKM